jgi:hypothetical protein
MSKKETTKTELGKEEQISGGEYTIAFPPVLDSFDLPSREQLLSLRNGDLVKLVFHADGCISERIWVQICDKLSGWEWVGVIDNYPLSIPVTYGEFVRFHPLCVIDITRYGEIRGNRLNSDMV